jgi:hypothetical protein
MKLNVNWQTAFLLLSMIVLSIVYLGWKGYLRRSYVTDSKSSEYIFAAVAGVFGGSLG